MTYAVFEAEDDYNVTCDGCDYGNYGNYCDYDCLPCDAADLHSFYAVSLPALYGVIFLLGVAGNGLMITVLLARRHRLRITEIYLLHLALADLMLLFTIPFDMADSATGWVFGEFVCKLNFLLKNLNLLCGSLLLACIGFDRYLAIVHAVPSLQSRFPRTVHLTCLVLWLTCLALAFPNAVFASVAQKQNSTGLTCYYYSFGIHANNWVLTNNFLHHVCFFLPLAIMSYCYTVLIITLCRSQKSEAKKGAIRIALLVTLVFCFCWLPYNVSLMLHTMTQLGVIEGDDCDWGKVLQQALEVTKSLGITHCCLNPFLYAFVGVRFRNEMIEMLCKLGCSRACRPLLRVHRHSSISDGATSNSMVLV